MVAGIGTAAAAGIGAGATAGTAAAVEAEAEPASETGEPLTLATPGATPLAPSPAAPARPESPDLDLSLELSLETLAQPSPSAPAQAREEPYELDLSDLEGWDLGVSLTSEPPTPAPTAPALPEALDLVTPTLGNLVLAPPASGSEPERESEPVLDLTAGDFDLDLENLGKQGMAMAPEPAADHPPGEPLEDLDLDLDDLMDLDLSAFTRAETPAEQPQAAPSQALPDWGALGIELELEEPPPEDHPGTLADNDFPVDFTLDTGHWDEVGIKLDLARAYLQMDDPEAARAILVEAIAEGTGDQIAEAKAMLARLE